MLRVTSHVREGITILRGYFMKFYSLYSYREWTSFESSHATYQLLNIC